GRTASLSIQSDASVPAPDIGISAIIDGNISTSFLSPNWVDFPPQAVGTPAPTQVLTFSDIVSAPIHVDAATFFGGDAGDFTSTTTCGSLPAGQSCSITIGFVPTAAGPRSTQLEVDYTATDGAGKHVRRFSVTGVGGPAGPIAPTQVVEYYNA